tara:strand:+ start:975 stop:1631 length:657 start_codon:yes stop_codon:yes gene_type:complete
MLENTYAEFTPVNSENLLLNILLKPKATFAYIFRNDPSRYVTVLFVLGGITNGVDRLIERESTSTVPNIAQLGISMLIGAALGWISYYIIAQFINIAGDYLRGKASVKQIRVVVAWALIPSIFSLFFLIPQYFIYGPNSDSFSFAWPPDIIMEDALLIFFKTQSLVLNIWSFVILIKGVAFIQNFSTGKAFWNVLLPFVIFAAIIFGFLALFAAINVL